MRSYEESQQKFNFVCFRCGSIIKPGDMMVTICVSLETPTLDRSIECTESSAVSSLCFPCASVILSEAVVGIKKLMKPNVTPEEIAEEETDIEQTMDCHHGGAKKDILLNLTPNHTDRACVVSQGN